MKFLIAGITSFAGPHLANLIYKPFWRPHEIFYQHGDSTNLKELTGFKEEFNIETTLGDLLNYWVNKIN
tara:strand:- start:350 stop:556 length:207 start_codon:yes stop_codon:yes gene_type:complete